MRNVIVLLSSGFFGKINEIIQIPVPGRYGGQADILLNFYHGRSGLTYCIGWGSVENAIASVHVRKDVDWNDPLIPF